MMLVFEFFWCPIVIIHNSYGRTVVIKLYVDGIRLRLRVITLIAVTTNT